MRTLPQDYLNRMRLQLGTDFEKYLAAMEQEPRKSIRINTLRASVEAAKGLLGELENNGITEEGFLVPDGFEGGKHLLHSCGLFYMQEASAQLPARFLNVEKGMAVLDLCAAPGGKSTQLAAYLGKTGCLVANEIVPKRAQVLLSNIERMGITNAVVTCMEPKILCERLKNSFDAVLVDAPCAGEGMFRKEKKAVGQWSLEHVYSCAARQKEILSSAQAALKKGGRLVYSTCSFSEEENEGVAEWFIKSYPEFSLVEQTRLYPHTCCGEGQYAAVFQKSGELLKSAYSKKEQRTLPDGRVVRIPPLPIGLEGLHIVRAGLLLGEQRKSVFVPSHACAMANGLENRVELSESEARRYLKGEMLCKQAPKGWCQLMFSGYPLGLGKSTNEGIKNHLPKGLRQFE